MDKESTTTTTTTTTSSQKETFEPPGFEVWIVIGAMAVFLYASVYGTIVVHKRTKGRPFARKTFYIVSYLFYLGKPTPVRYFYCDFDPTEYDLF